MEHIAFSEIAHLDVESALFAQRLRAGSITASSESVVGSEDPAIRVKRLREIERKRREDAKRKAKAVGAAGAHNQARGQPASQDEQPCFTGPCKNKPCVQRNDVEGKLLARRGKIKLELGRKVKRFHSLQRTVVEKEKQRDEASAESISLKNAVEIALEGMEDRQRRTQKVNEEIRQVTGELSPLEVEFRNLRKRHQEAVQPVMPLPRGLVSSNSVEWPTSYGKPFTPDGLTVTFIAVGRSRRQKSGKQEVIADSTDGGGGLSNHCNPSLAWQPPSCFDDDPLCDEPHNARIAAWKYPSRASTTSALAREHPGKFGRWGTEVREQWSCCLWEKKENTNKNSRRPSSSVAGGCEIAPPPSIPGGMTTSDDVHLVLRRSTEITGHAGERFGEGCDVTAGEAFETRLTTNDAGRRMERRPRELSGWSYTNKQCSEAVRSPIRGRPQTTLTKIGMEALTPSSRCAENTFYLRDRGDRTHDGSCRSRGFTARYPVRSWPDSAPSKMKMSNDHLAVRRVSSLTALRQARAKAGWQLVRVGPSTNNDYTQICANEEDGLVTRSGWSRQSQESLLHVGSVSVYSQAENTEKPAGSA